MTAPLAYPFPSAPTEGEAVDIAPGVKWLRLPLPMALDHVNVYALDDGAGWTLVDTGMASDHSIAIWKGLIDGPLAGKAVTRLIATHHHPDHLGLAGWFQDQGVELVTARTAWLYARMLTLDEQQRPAPESLRFLTLAGLDREDVHARSLERPFNFCDMVAPMPMGFTRIDEGDVLQAGGRRWRIHLGQGHAPDHATLWSLDDHLVLAGDQFLATISPNIGVYPTEPDADPLAEWLTACRRFRPMAREDHLILPGHKLPFTGLPGRLDAMIAEHEDGLDRLAHLLATPSRAVDCFAALFRRPIRPETFGLALAETMAHLNCLWKAGRATRTLAPEGAWLWQAT